MKEAVLDLELIRHTFGRRSGRPAFNPIAGSLGIGSEPKRILTNQTE